MGVGSGNDNFPLLYVLKTSLPRARVGGLKKVKTLLRKKEMVPKLGNFACHVAFTFIK